MVHVRFPVAGKGRKSRWEFRPVPKDGFTAPAGSVPLQSAALQTHSGGRNGLAVVRIRHISGGEQSRRPGRHHPCFPDNVAGIVPVHQIPQERSVRRVPDRHKDAFDGKFRFIPFYYVLQHDGFQFSLVVRLIAYDGGIPHGENLFIGQRSFRHDFGSAERVAAVDQVHPGSEARQEHGFFTGAVSSAYHAHRHVPVKSSVTGGAGGESVANQPFLSRYSQIAGGCSRSHNDTPGFVILAAGLHGEQSGGFIPDDALDVLICKPGAELFRLLLHQEHQVRPHHAVRKAGEVFHFRRGGQLSADLGTRDQKRREIGAGGVNGRRVTSAAGTDDNDLFAHNSIYVRCHGKGPVPVLRVDFALCGDNAAACNPAVAGRVPAVAEKSCLHVSLATVCNILALSAGRLLSRVPFKDKRPGRPSGDFPNNVK